MQLMSAVKTMGQTVIILSTTPCNVSTQRLVVFEIYAFFTFPGERRVSKRDIKSNRILINPPTYYN